MLDDEEIVVFFFLFFSFNEYAFTLNDSYH